VTETVALVVAAGRGTRMSGDVPKQYRLLAGKSILRRTLDCFASHPGIARVYTVIHPDDADDFRAASAGLAVEEPVHGGASRQDSVRNGLEHLADKGAPDCVLIHDGARPFLDPLLVDNVIAALLQSVAAIPVLEVHDTLKRLGDDGVAGTVDRNGLVRAQTPQGFRFPEILSAHRGLAGRSLTDDAAVAEAMGLTVTTVPGREENIKITRDEDLHRAALWLQADQDTRVGSGFDVHRFEAGDSVRLGGIDIPYDKRLAGHSDADVALHALTDALLGALGDGDIGSHFPPSDPQWQGSDSARFLMHARDILSARGGRIVHADLTIICEAPKIGPHRAPMRDRIAQILDVGPGRVSIKATTTEGLGFTGRNEGIAAQATVTIRVGSDG
jgi:2-C-methyl-D-erythritol 4-phosphate cytidylyltransferase/2-C-methyl-D-erythritol 2,4-cyclodiphosphate synthase